MGIIAIIIVILLIKIRCELTIAVSSLLFFIIISMASLSFKVQIKNAIAFQTGYFKTKIIKTSTDKLKSVTTKFRQPEAGYEVDIPGDWKLRTDKGPYFNYFQLMDRNTIIAEFRPRCFGKNNIALTDIVFNIRIAAKTIKQQLSTHCQYHGKSFYSCNVSHYNTTDNKIRRINWVGTRDDIIKGISLDFVLYQSNPEILQDIRVIIESIHPSTATLSDLNCLGLAEWF